MGWASSSALTKAGSLYIVKGSFLSTMRGLLEDLSGVGVRLGVQGGECVGVLDRFGDGEGVRVRTGVAEQVIFRLGGILRLLRVLSIDLSRGVSSFNISRDALCFCLEISCTF